MIDQKSSRLSTRANLGDRLCVVGKYVPRGSRIVTMFKKRYRVEREEKGRLSMRAYAAAVQ